MSFNKSTDFYYNYCPTGKKTYYSISGKRVAKTQIPEKVLNQIEERPVYNRIDLQNRRKAYTDQIKYLTDKVLDIDTLLWLCDANPQYLYNLKRKRDEEIINRLRELNENLHHSLINSFIGDIPKSSETNDLLKELGIHCERDYHIWLLKKHPDKELVSDVQRLCKNRGW